MKINGREFKTKNTQVIVIPREEGPAVFKAEAVTDYSTFDSLCPPPRPPIIQRPNQVPVEDPTNLEFRQKVGVWAQKKGQWAIIQSLKATPGLVWEKVLDGDPETWKYWIEELKESHFTEAEISKILQAYMRANSLDEAFLEEARKSFFIGEREAREKLSSPTEEPTSTQSGPAVNALDSALPV